MRRASRGWLGMPQAARCPVSLYDASATDRHRWIPMKRVARWIRIRGRPRVAKDAKRTWPTREGLALVISDGERDGRGEIAPLPGLSGDALEAAERALAAIPWDELDLRSEDPFAIARRIVPAEFPSVRFGVEVALLDLVGRRDGRPVAAMLADPAPASSVETAALITDLEEALRLSRSAVDAGARTIKVKIGRPGRRSEELALLRALRRELGEAVAIRADANRALEPSSRHPLLGALAEIGAEWVEDPFPIERLVELDRLPVPVAIDEDVARDPVRAMEALERGLAQILVLKPALVGGLGRALALSEAARERGGSAVVGHLYDPPTAFAAAAHLALAIGGARAHGLGRYPGLESWRDEHGQSLAVPSWIDAHRIVLPTSGGVS